MSDNLPSKVPTFIPSTPSAPPLQELNQNVARLQAQGSQSYQEELLKQSVVQQQPLLSGNEITKEPKRIPMYPANSSYSNQEYMSRPMAGTNFPFSPTLFVQETSSAPPFQESDFANNKDSNAHDEQMNKKQELLKNSVIQQQPLLSGGNTVQNSMPMPTCFVNNMHQEQEYRPHQQANNVANDDCFDEECCHLCLCCICECLAKDDTDLKCCFQCCTEVCCFWLDDAH